MGTRLWVGNLPFDATEAEMRTLFSENGRQVASVILKSDRVTGRPAGFGFVEMGSDEFAQQAVRELDGRMLRGRPMRVNEARPPGSGPRPGGPRPPFIGGGPPRDGGTGGFRRPFPPGPLPDPNAPAGARGPRGRKERREKERERSEKREEEKTRGGGGRKRRFGGDDDD